MSEEEKKAIEDLIKEIIILKENSNKIIDSKELLNYKETLFKLITRQKQELEKEKETSHYIQNQLDIANAKLVEEKEKNKKIKDILQKYAHTLVGDEEKILEFYKELKETFI